jgi:hypothetical protein
MTLLVYCAWETRVMRANVMLSNKAAIRTMAQFMDSSNDEPFEAQVLDCVSIVINLCKPEMLAQVTDSQASVCESEGFLQKPCRTMFGRQFFQACAKLGLIDPTKMLFGGLCSGQFGWPTQQLHSVDIRQLSEEEVRELSSKGFYHWYSPKQFTQEQLEWLMNGGVIRNTFGIADVDLWESCDVFEMIED